MSENICFPAKIVHGHIKDLIEKKVDRILFPRVIFDRRSFLDAINSFLCPIITGYPDLIASVINPKDKHNIPLDSPSITFADKHLLKKEVFAYLSELGVDKKIMAPAFEKAFQALLDYKAKLIEEGKRIIEVSKKENQRLFILAGRPYHADPLVNHKIPEMITQFGVNVISEDSIPFDRDNMLAGIEALTQWEYSNRLYAAANWVLDKINQQTKSIPCHTDLK